MIFHENRLLAYFLKIGKDVAKFVIYCSHDWCFKAKRKITFILTKEISQKFFATSFVQVLTEQNRICPFYQKT